MFTSSQLLQAFVFTGRGGALAITVNTTFSLDAEINNCTFINNRAVSFSGGLYLGYSGYASHTTTINRSLLAENHCIGPSGGLQIGYLEGADNGFTVRLEMFNSVLHNNKALYGGGVHLFANRKYIVRRLCI